MEQRSPDWFAARCGSLGASQVADALAQNKSGGWAASRANVMATLITERLTGLTAEGYVNAAMQHGIGTEAQARSAYAFVADVDVAEIGLVPHPTIAGTHASPDGLVGDDGLVEIKAPTSATHIDTLLSGRVADRYVQQMLWQMACTGRAWCDFVSFDPRLPGDLQLFVKRFERDDARIADLEDGVRLFLMETEAKLRRLLELRSAA